MSNTPLVTVAMVTYNSERFVEEAIQSVLSSSYSNFELLISDDHSKDNTWKLISGFSDHRIKATRNITNIGEYRNRNECIKRASGKYLIFIDGDDILYPHGLEFMVRMMEDFPECAMALSRPADQRFIYPVELSPRELYQLHFFDKTVLNFSFARNFFRVDALRAVGGLSDAYRAGDDYIRLKIAAKYKCLLIHDGLTWWRKSEGQASEKLMVNDLGLIEQYKMKSELLSSGDVPLVPEEVAHAQNNLRIRYARLLLKRIAKLDLRGFLSLKRAIAFTMRDVIYFSMVLKPVEKRVEFRPSFAKAYMSRRQ